MTKSSTLRRTLGETGLLGVSFMGGGFCLNPITQPDSICLVLAPSRYLKYTKNFLPVQPQFLGVLGPNRSRPNGVRHLYFGQEKEIALSQVRPQPVSFLYFVQEFPVEGLYFSILVYPG
jgi:hypothetical protein